MKKKLKYIITVIVVLAAAYLYAHIAKANVIYDKEIDSSDYKSTEAVLDGPVSQQFRCVEKTLDGISVKSKVIGTPEQATIVYTLTEVSTGQIAAEGEVDAAKVKNSKFYKFSFDQVTDCKDRDYIFEARVDGATQEDAVAFYYEVKQEENTNLSVNGAHKEGTLILKTITNRFDLETFIVVLFFVLYIVVFIKFLYKLFK